MTLSASVSEITTTTGKEGNMKTRLALAAVGLIGIVLGVLKLAGMLSWSWGWVLSPFWGTACVVAGMALYAFVSVLRKGRRGEEVNPENRQRPSSGRRYRAAPYGP
jgi:hypothetical protein